MKVQGPQKLITNKNNTPGNEQQVSFKGIEAPLIQVLNFLDTNQAWGAVAVDVGSMCIPRTIIDSTRGPAAGIETARREFSTTGNNALVGVYGSLAGLALCQAFNKDFGVKANKIFVSTEMLDILAHNWNESKNESEPLEKFLNKVVLKIEGFNPNAKNIDSAGWVKINSEAKEAVVSKFAKEIKEGPEKISKETMAYLKAVITGSVGSESKVKLEQTLDGKVVKAVSDLDNLIGNIYNLSKTFVNGKVADTFKVPLKENKFINGLKNLNTRISLIGVGLAVGIGLCVQPLNVYLTKKKTGKSGFVGVEGRENDKSNGFKVLKIGTALVCGLAVLKSIGKLKPSELLKNIKFKSSTPTLNQFKLIYGMTIASRLLSARDKNELRETTIKDSLGFASWLILGGFVSKFTAAGIEKLPMFKDKGEKFIRYNKSENGEGFFNWLTKSNIVTRNEVLIDALKDKAIKNVDGKKVAMTFKEMFKAAPDFAKTKVRYLGLIQAAGYLYSGIALGIGIPKLNIAITKHFEGKKHKGNKE